MNGDLVLVAVWCLHLTRQIVSSHNISRVRNARCEGPSLDQRIETPNPPRLYLGVCGVVVSQSIRTAQHGPVLDTKEVG